MFMSFCIITLPFLVCCSSLREKEENTQTMGLGNPPNYENCNPEGWVVLERLHCLGLPTLRRGRPEDRQTNSLEIGNSRNQASRVREGSRAAEAQGCWWWCLRPWPLRRGCCCMIRSTSFAATKHYAYQVLKKNTNNSPQQHDPHLPGFFCLRPTAKLSAKGLETTF
jgi:hypothetical protein